MHYESITTLIKNLNDAAVEYLVVGGLAVVAHGYVRFTADVDLLLGLDHANVKNEAFGRPVTGAENPLA